MEYVSPDYEYYAKLAFNAYGDKANWKTWNNLPMPQWNEVGEEVQSRWIAAVKAVIKELTFFE
jgi:hypothetical protein